MIIYNKTWLDNLKIHKLAEDEQDANCITDDEAKAIKQKYPVGFYTPGPFIRMGLFVLVFIIVIVSTGLLSLILLETKTIDSFGWPLFLGIVTYVALEVIVNGQHHYKSGVDDALLWISAGLITGAYVWFISSINSDYTHDHYFAISTFIFLFSLCLTLRFADMLMSLVTCLSLLATVYFGWQNIGALGIATLPFVMILVSAGIYFTTWRLTGRKSTLHYANCLLTIQLTSLVALYIAGNYYVVSELSNQLNNDATIVRKPLPLGFFFWGWSLLLPFVYIAGGLWKKNAMLLRIGLLMIALAIGTFRYYHHILSPEVAFTLGGIIILTGMYLLVKYLKKPKHGFTYADINKRDLANNIKIEALITAEAFGHTPSAPVEPKSRFGGGSFGGGGSSSNY